MARSAAQKSAQHRWYNEQQARQLLGENVQMPARFAGTCGTCGQSFDAGAAIVWNTTHRTARHQACAGYAPVAAAPAATKACRVCGLAKPAKLTAANATCGAGRSHEWRTVQA